VALGARIGGLIAVEREWLTVLFDVEKAGRLSFSWAVQVGPSHEDFAEKSHVDFC